MARPPRLTHDQRILLLALAAAAPGTAMSMIVLWTGDYTPKVQWTLTVLIGGCLLGFLSALRSRVVTPLQTTANLLSALREGDFSIRARGSRSGDPLNDVMLEVNVLADTLRGQRLDALEATALLRKVMMEIDVAVFTFDERQRLQLVNRAGERLLGSTAERLLDRTAEELDLGEWLQSPESPRVAAISFPGGSGRWEIRKTSFRQHGLPHHLLVLSDVSKPLREEERQAWQRLIRVLGHELNNSLAPIKSIAGSLGSLIQRDPRPPDWQEDVQRGLAVISTRAEALSRFMGAYARLARLPPPRFQMVNVPAFVDRVIRLETRMAVDAPAGAEPGRAGGWRSARAAADQPGEKRGRRRLGDRRRGAGRLGAASAARRHFWRSTSTTRGRACRIRRTCSCRFSPRNRPDRALAWSSAGRSPRPTAAR